MARRCVGVTGRRDGVEVQRIEATRGGRGGSPTTVCRGATCGKSSDQLNGQRRPPRPPRTGPPLPTVTDAPLCHADPAGRMNCGAVAWPTTPLPFVVTTLPSLWVSLLDLSATALPPPSPSLPCHLDRRGECPLPLPARPLPSSSSPCLRTATDAPRGRRRRKSPRQQKNHRLKKKPIYDM